MVSKLILIKTDSTNPYENLAFEEYLTRNVNQDECILYLWQNRRTVVVGKNQNCWKECRVGALEEDGGFLARRLSGGGAVYHDMGNLNFSFCTCKENYNVERQLEVILQAVQALGICAKKSGRNDLTIDGRKFSGNAFLRMGGKCCHHGTIMLDVNMDDLSRYLLVDRSKLVSKGVESVRARVASLSEFCKEATVWALTVALKLAFSKVYALNVTVMPETVIPVDEVRALRHRFQSDDWKYGRKIPFDYEIARRFTWGDIQLQLHVENGYIVDVNLFSDAMDSAMIESFQKALIGVEYQPKSMSAAVLEAGQTEDGQPEDGSPENSWTEDGQPKNGRIENSWPGKTIAPENRLPGMASRRKMGADFARLIREEI